MLMRFLWSCTSIIPAVKVDDIALALGTLNAVGEAAAPAARGTLLNMENLKQTLPQTHWIQVCILTRTPGIYPHIVKHENTI